MTKKRCGFFLTLSIITALAACSSSKENAGSSTAPSAAVSSLATDAPKVTDPTNVSPQTAPSATPTIAPQASPAPATSPAATATATPKPSIAPTSAPKASAASEDSSSAAPTLFKQNCVSCHGVELQGDFGPNLQKVGGRLTKDQITKQIHDGGGDMPPFGTQLKDEEIQSLATWLSAKK
jgi:cytochrome c551